MRFLLLLFTPFALFAQNLQTDWQKPFGADVKINAMMEATNGYLVAVGETTAKTQGGSDGLLIIADHSTGQLVTEIRYGGSKDDVLNALAQTHDGRFLLAGTTASTGNGGEDAWLLMTDEKGKKIWETTFGTPGKDICQAMTLLPDGSALLLGSQNGQKNGDVWLAKIQNKQLIWESNLGRSEFETISGMVLISDGVVFAGNTGKKAENGSGDVYLAKTDDKGNLLWKKWFGEKGWEEALALIATRDGGFALAGLTKSKGAGDLDGWLLKTSRDGFRQWDKTFGGKDADLFNALLQSNDGRFLLFGSSKSQRSGARFTDAFAVKTSSGGELEWENYTGRDRDDVFKTICPLHNGSMVLIAEMEGSTVTLLRLSDPEALTGLLGMRDVATPTVSAAVVHSPDGTLTPGEHTYLSFQVNNTTDIDLNDLRVTVENRTGSDLLAWNTNYFGALPKGKTTEVHIPLEAKNSLTPGEQQLSITVSSGTKSLKTFEKTVALRKPKPATLIIAGHQFEVSNRNDELTLNVQIENSGDSSSRAAEVRFLLPAGLKASSNTSQPMGVIGAQSKRPAKVVFLKTVDFKESVARITCIVLENTKEKVRKTFEYQVQTGGGGGAKGPILIWTDPAPHETGTNKVRKTDDHFEFKMTVVSPKPVKTKDIKMKVNGVEMDGSKYNEQELSAPIVAGGNMVGGNEGSGAAQYTYTYRNKIPLEQGTSRVEVVVEGQSSQPLEVEFVPQRANLHILAIGPRHEDLQYTIKDATDFANAFQNQGGAGKLYNQVLIHALTAPEQTDMTGIKQALFDLAFQWDDKQISPNDVLIVFLSSHGKIVENRFKILQTGYNPKYDRLTIDFKTDILEVLNSINCKKLIFLDACHSGGAKEGFGGLSKAIVDLAQAQPGVSTLSSCSSTEKSYEDKTWENGAFTEALLEAFNDKACTDKSGIYQADANRDHVIRLGELYDFLRRRVPALVQNTVPNAPTGQTPFMPENQLDKDLPIYWIEK